jgi:hypothetical protein
MLVGMRARVRTVAIVVGLALACAACATNKYAGAGANAGAAAVIYAATGCKYAACPHGTSCNPDSGLCESLPCGEMGCSGSEECDVVHHACVPAGSLAPMPVSTVSPTAPTSSPGGP